MLSPEVYATDNVLPVISGQCAVFCCGELVKQHQVRCGGLQTVDSLHSVLRLHVLRVATETKIKT